MVEGRCGAGGVYPITLSGGLDSQFQNNGEECVYRRSQVGRGIAGMPTEGRSGPFKSMMIDKLENHQNIGAKFVPRLKCEEISRSFIVM
jgi:hypothetical protein